MPLRLRGARPTRLRACRGYHAPAASDRRSSAVATRRPLIQQARTDNGRIGRVAEYQINQPQIQFLSPSLPFPGQRQTLQPHWRHTIPHDQWFSVSLIAHSLRSFSVIFGYHPTVGQITPDGARPNARAIYAASNCEGHRKSSGNWLPLSKNTPISTGR